MTFDSEWEMSIYAQGKQFNRYPFDWVVSTVNRLFRDPADRASSSVVELGSGAGNNLKFLLDFGFGSVHGIEGSRSALSIAKDYLSDSSARLKLIEADFRTIPAEDGEYALILDRGSITHNDLDSCRAILAESFRVLRPGGYLISTLFSNLHSQIYTASKIGPSFYRAFRDAAGVSTGLNTSFLTIKDVIDALQNFEIVSCVSDVKTELIGPPAVTGMWYVIARKPA
jgi:SAM-dependent methyltransferase